MAKFAAALAHYLEVLYIGYVNQSPVANRLLFSEWLDWVAQAAGPAMVFKSGGALIIPPAQAALLSGVPEVTVEVRFTV